MRTTLEIDDNVIEAARAPARRGLAPDESPVVEVQDGIPIWKHSPGAIPVRSEMLRNLAEEE
jgi:hypothetical protein